MNRYMYVWLKFKRVDDEFDNISLSFFGYTVWANFVLEFSFCRSPPHPFITVLTISPEQATVLIQQVNLLLLNSINIKRYRAACRSSSLCVKEEIETS